MVNFNTLFRLVTIAGIYCLSSYAVIAQSSLIAADQLFEEAEQLFYLKTPTEATDLMAIEKYQQAIQQYSQANIYPLKQAEAYQKIGNILEVSGKVSDALDTYHLSLAIKKKMNILPDSIFFIDYVYLGDIHQVLQNYDSAEYFYDQAEKIALLFNNLVEADRLFNSIGLLHYSLGNYKQAANYYNRSLNLLKKDNPYYLRFKIRSTNNIAEAKRKLGLNREAITLYRSILFENIDLPITYQNLGKAYSGIQQYDSASYFLRRALSSDHLPTKLAAHTNFGEVFLKQNNLDSSLFYFEKSIAINKQEINSKNTSLAEAYMGMGEVMLARNNFSQALVYYQQALINTVFSFNTTDVNRNPENSQDAISLLHLFSVLQGKGQAFYQFYQQDEDTTKLKNALACYRDAIKLAKHIQKSYDTDDAKLFFIEHIFPVFEEALATTYSLYELTQDPQYVAIALSIAESSKASVLSETLKDIEIKSTGIVNDSLIKEEKRLKQRITSLRIKLAESSDSVQNQVYQTSLIDLEIMLSHTIKQLQKDEKYYQLKYQDDTINLESIQQKAIGPDAVALEYVTGQDALYIFLITKEKMDLKRISITSEFSQTLQRVQDHLYNYQIGRRYEERRNTSQLYQYLLAPYQDDIKMVDRLIIIPDGKLSYIPFEMLSAPTIPSHYLIQDYTFNYAYSATLLLEAIEHRNVKLASTVLAMAPFVGKDQGNIRSSGFNLLAASREEVEKVGGSIYLENKATKRLFLKVASSYGILHLATHASVDSKDPLQSYIAFYPDKGESDAGYRLYTRELYNLKLDSVRLVVLSACETGSGQLVQGEGIISLARAFAYAGCSNIVTTLWKADDKTAAEITTSMHQYLKSGYTKDAALRLAKLDYLNSDIHPVLKSPYYWANFIFIGDPAPIYSSYTFVWYIAIGVIILIIAIWMMRKQILNV